MRVVLVEPRVSRNVGSVARAMANFGFRELCLVSPRDYDREQAGVTARDASQILDQATFHSTLADAVSDCVDVVGFALRSGPSPARCTTLPVWAEFRADVRTALVYGPEDDDLRHEHLDLCRWIVRIPSHSDYPSLNLAQSVLVTLYELSRIPGRLPGNGSLGNGSETQRSGALQVGGAGRLTDDWLGIETAGCGVDDAPGLEVTSDRASPEATVLNRPTANDLGQLDRLIGQVMEASGFVRPGSPRTAARTVGTLFRRMDLDRGEMSALTALFGRIDAALSRRDGKV